MNTKLLDTILKGGVLTAIIAFAMPELALADAANVGTAATKVVGQMKDFPKIVSGVAYIGGGILLISGALSLKKHAENPGSEPLGKGIGRLAAGGGVISLPALAKVINDSLSMGTGSVTYAPLSQISN